MAQTITEFTRPEAQGNRKYPWDEWCDGRIWRVVRGTDFTSTPASFRGNLTNRASAKGLTVVTRVYENAVEFQFSPKETT